MKLFQKLQDWVSWKMEDLCSKLSPRTQRNVVFALFFSFACCSLYIFGDALYRIGKNEGIKGNLNIEHIDSVPLINMPDSIKPLLKNNKEYGYKR